MALPAIIAGGASIIGSVGSYLSNLRQARTAKRNTDRTIQANREMAEYAYSKDLEMWQRQNEYNTPEQQMERFRAAGLNPNLMYGQGSSGQATQMPQYNAPRMDYGYKASESPLGLGAGTMQGISQYMDLRQKSANLDLTQRHIKTQETVADLNNVRTSGILQENTIRAVEASIAQLVLRHQGQDFHTIAKGRIGSMKSDEWLKQANAQIRQYEAKLTENGINPRDSAELRLLFQFLENIGFSPGDLGK